MWEDPIVDEVRKHREEYAKKFGNDLRRIFEDLRRQQQDSGISTVSFPPRRPESLKNQTGEDEASEAA